MSAFRNISCAILFVSFFCLTTTAQRRSCDTKPIVISPEAYDTLISPSEINLKIGIVNLGPDTLTHSDNYRINYRYGGVITNYEFYGFNQEVYPGDTFFHNAKFKVEFWVSVDSVDFCAEVKAWNTNSNGLIPETGAALSNNRGCTPTTHIDNNPTSGFPEDFQKESVEVYPNPATNHINIHVQNLSKLSVTDLQGKTILNTIELHKGVHHLNVVDWPRGIYLVQLQDEKHTGLRKLILR